MHAHKHMNAQYVAKRQTVQTHIVYLVAAALRVLGLKAVVCSQTSNGWQLQKRRRRGKHVLPHTSVIDVDSKILFPKSSCARERG